jgi:hypothetical protein
VEGGGPTNYQGFSSSTLKREARSGTAAAAGTWELGIIRLRGLVQAEISQARVSAVADAGSGPSPSEAACASHARAARP